LLLEKKYTNMLKIFVNFLYFLAFYLDKIFFYDIISILIDAKASKFTILGEKTLWITAIVTVTVEVHI
jgi:hypothetical protein